MRGIAMPTWKLAIVEKSGQVSAEKSLGAGVLYWLMVKGIPATR